MAYSVPYCLRNSNRNGRRGGGRNKLLCGKCGSHGWLTHSAGGYAWLNGSLTVSWLQWPFHSLWGLCLFITSVPGNGWLLKYKFWYWSAKSSLASLCGKWRENKQACAVQYLGYSTGVADGGRAYRLRRLCGNQCVSEIISWKLRLTPWLGHLSFSRYICVAVQRGVCVCVISYCNGWPRLSLRLAAARLCSWLAVLCGSKLK